MNDKKNTPFGVETNIKSFPDKRPTTGNRKWDVNKIISVLNKEQPKYFDFLGHNMYHQVDNLNKFEDGNHGFHLKEKMTPRTKPGTTTRLANGKFAREIDHKYYDWVEDHGFHEGPLNLSSLMKETSDHFAKKGDHGHAKNWYMWQGMISQTNKDHPDKKQKVLNENVPFIIEGLKKQHPKRNYIKYLLKDKPDLEFDIS